MILPIFSIGQKFKHYNGYVWEIKEIKGKTIRLESIENGCTIKGAMSNKELKNIINSGYYTPLN
jgi:hypothetical protein